MNTEQMTVNTVIFDIGNVLMGFDQIAYMQELLKDEETVRHVDQAIWGSGYWDELDRGADPEELFSAMEELDPPYKEEIRRTLEHVDLCMSRKDYAIPWIQELKAKGLRVLYLSNYSHYVMDIKPEVLDFVPYMDGGIFSCDVKLIKPDTAIYRKLCDTYQLEPERCVFVDDREPNVEAARSVGLRAICFQTKEQAQRELEALLTTAE